MAPSSPNKTATLTSDEWDEYVVGLQAAILMRPNGSDPLEIGRWGRKQRPVAVSAEVRYPFDMLIP
jgi:hypothetical protein